MATATHETARRGKSGAGRPMDARPSGPGTALSNFLIDHLGELDLTNQEIADKLGYARPNIISMWKAGRTKFTIDNVFPVAELLGVDPAFMLALYFDQYVSDNMGGIDHFPTLLKMVNHICTDDEWQIIEAVRKARKGNSMKITKEQRDSLKTLFAVPAGTLPGPYQPIGSLDHMGEKDAGDRRRFARRGHGRDMSITEIEEAASVRAAEETKAAKPKVVRKRPAKRQAEVEASAE